MEYATYLSESNGSLIPGCVIILGKRKFIPTFGGTYIKGLHFIEKLLGLNYSAAFLSQLL